jgi:ribosomal-protein-alanine N-acetyltransferase
MFGLFRRKTQFFVENATAGDMGELAEIHDESFPQGWDADALATLVASRGVSALVAREEGGGGRVSGFALMRVAADEAEVLTIAVAPRMRRHGAARALMLRLLSEARREGARRLFLEVSEENSGAIRLYRSFGFRQCGYRKGYYASHGGAAAASGQPPGALVMEVDLR